MCRNLLRGQKVLPVCSDTLRGGLGAGQWAVINRMCAAYCGLQSEGGAHTVPQAMEGHGFMVTHRPVKI